MEKIIKKILVANRGVPAVRIMHTCRDRKIPTTAVYSAPDRISHHVYMADSAVHIGEAPPQASYLNKGKIVEAALRSGADAIHPGWGFLSENADFAQMVRDAGLVWIGPRPEVIRLVRDKIEAGKIAEQAHVPVIPGMMGVQGLLQIQKWMQEEKIRFPILIKAAALGRGGEMIKVENEMQLSPAVAQARAEASKVFGDEAVMVEKYIERARHIEVQVVADGHGHCVHLYERECTIQYGNQKIIEEAPSPTLDQDLRREMCSTALSLMREIGYESAGTVEFLVDSSTKKYYFLKVNPGLQAEHGLTELIAGLDIVGIMLDVAQGRELPFGQSDIHPNRWALEARLNAQDPKTFAPSFGTITRLLIPVGPNVRVASGVFEGSDVPPNYGPLFMLLMTSGADRLEAIRVMDRALGRNLRVEGVKTLAPLLLSIIRHPAFIQGDFSTRFIEEHMEELISMFREKNSEDEVLKIARYVAEVSALGPAKWV
jgi:acetyl-CoA carboxylase biotin carboxylase subunit/propionyl-CoA carboxylase alpha chain